MSQELVQAGRKSDKWSWWTGRGGKNTSLPVVTVSVTHENHVTVRADIIGGLFSASPPVVGTRCVYM